MNFVLLNLRIDGMILLESYMWSLIGIFPQVREVKRCFSGFYSTGCNNGSSSNDSCHCFKEFVFGVCAC